MKTQSIKIIVEQTNDGFSAYAENLNIFSTGNDVTELKKNIACCIVACLAPHCTVWEAQCACVCNKLALTNQALGLLQP